MTGTDAMRSTGNVAGNFASRGFTLLEVLVAFAVAALALTALLQLYATSAASADRGIRTLAAVGIAEDRFAELADPALLVPGTASGAAAGGYAWRREIVLARPAGDDRLLDLLQVIVAVDGPDGREVLRLETARTVPPAIEGSGG